MKRGSWCHMEETQGWRQAMAEALSQAKREFGTCKHEAGDGNEGGNAGCAIAHKEGVNDASFNIVQKPQREQRPAGC